MRLTLSFSLSQRGSLEDALRQLYVLDAIDAEGHITPLGRQMVQVCNVALATHLYFITQGGCFSRADAVWKQALGLWES